MNNFGLITPTDAANLEFGIFGLIDELNLQTISILEIGVHSGDTARAMKNVVESIGVKIDYVGIDSQADKPIFPPFEGARVILKSSVDAYWESPVSDIVIVDGCHNLQSTATDFLLYKDRVRTGGLFIFHDTGKHIKPFTDYQGSGDTENPDNWIACRRALDLLGLYDAPELRGFVLLLDSADEDYHTGGYTIFRKL